MKNIFRFFWIIIVFIFKLYIEIFKLIPAFFKFIKLIIKFIFKVVGTVINKIKNLFRFSISFKITVVYGFIFTLILTFISFTILIGFNLFLTSEYESDTLTNFEALYYYIDSSLDIPKDYLSEFSKKQNVKITLLDEDKNILYTSNNETLNFIYTRRLTFTNSNKIIISDKFKNNNYLQIEKYLTDQKHSLEILGIILFSINFLAILFSIIIGSKVSRRMLQPIKSMTDTVKDITINDLDKRLDIHVSKDELKDLTETVNKMLDRIESSYEKQNQFVSDASHELRTPISVIQGYANLLNRWGKDDKKVLEESIIAIKSESENMKNLVEKLLFLARSDKNNLKLELNEFSLGDLLNEIIKETKLIDSNHTIKSDIIENTNIKADYRLMKQAIRIFVDNSIKFTSDNGCITLNCYKKRNSIFIEIKDTGIGIPKKELPHIFDRFYRVDKARSKKMGGNGLGLSIAKWIIEKHNGTIDIKSVVNVGTNITITLPHLK